MERSKLLALGDGRWKAKLLSRDGEEGGRVHAQCPLRCEMHLEVCVCVLCVWACVCGSEVNLRCPRIQPFPCPQFWD